METFKKSFPSKPFKWPKGKAWALAGVVGSGNLEVLAEPGKAGSASFAVETSIPGYKAAWLAALKDLSTHYALGGCQFTIHDQGAPPILITLRVRQVLEQIGGK